MSIVKNEACGTENTKNTGGKRQCLEKAVRTYFLGKKDFSFASQADAKDASKWEEAIMLKNLVPFYDIDEDAELNNTDALVKEARFRDIEVKAAVKGVNYTHYLDVCSYDALYSYHQSTEYTQVFRVSEANGLEVVIDATTGAVTGVPLQSFIVGVRNEAVGDTPPMCMVSMKFDEYSPSIIIPTPILTQTEGIYDVELSIVGTPSATTIVFSAVVGCAQDEDLTSIILGNINLLDSSGAEQTGISLAAYDANTGTYTITGTGLVTGTLALKNDGTPAGSVFKKGTILYESNTAALTI